MLPAQAGSQAIPDAGLGVAIRGLLVAQAIGRPNETNFPTDCQNIVSVRCRNCVGFEVKRTRPPARPVLKPRGGLGPATVVTAP